MSKTSQIIELFEPRWGRATEVAEELGVTKQLVSFVWKREGLKIVRPSPKPRAKNPTGPQSKTPEERYARRVLNRIKRRALREGIPFNLTLPDIKVPSHCPVLGIPLIIGNTKDNVAHSPSVDRIDSRRGYVKDNIEIISWRANRIKCDATLEEISAIQRYMKRGLKITNRKASGC